eukprot:TRINITY_DN33328_c0_g1_i1.p1 TRINITY_DN33328_c0_g1~~TRINITY_DN33328_c0_g1_i1.p1  ORF type:complete len:319 (+),score=144.45 TRINITY_DN33328_c0_g1_i1:68-1024(+)
MRGRGDAEESMDNSPAHSTSSATYDIVEDHEDLLASRGKTWFEWEQVRPVDGFTSHFVSLRTLLIVRTVFVLWNVPACVYVGVVYQWSADSPKHNKIPLIATLSYLHYCALVLYLVVAVVLSYRRRVENARAEAYATLYHRSIVREEWEPLTGGVRVMFVMFEVIVPITWLVTLVYWTALYSARQLGYLTFQLHAANSFISLTEMLLVKWVPRKRHFVFVVLLGAGYIASADLTHHLTGQWVYWFLRLDQIQAAYFVPALFVVGLIMYMVAYGVAVLRERHAHKMYLPTPRNSVVGGTNGLHDPVAGSSFQVRLHDNL